MSTSRLRLVVMLFALSAWFVPLCADEKAAPPITIDETSEDLREKASRFWAATFSHDGKSLAVTAGWNDPAEPGELMIWDVAGRRLKLLRRQDETIRCVDYSPDDKFLAIGDFGGRTRILDAASGRVVTSLRDHEKLINTVRFTPDGKSLVTGSFDGTVRVWDVATGKELHAFTLKDEAVVTLDISRDGRLLAAVTWQGDAHVWDLAKRSKLHTIEAHGSKADRSRIVEGLAFAPDGKSFVTGAWDTTLAQWSTADGTRLREFKGHEERIMTAAFAPDGKTLASSDSTGRLLLWNAATGENLATITAHAKQCSGVAFSPDSKMIATASWDQMVKLWDVAMRKEIVALMRTKP